MFLLSTFTLIFLTGHLLVHARPVSISSGSSFSSGVSPTHVLVGQSHRQGVRVHRRSRPLVSPRISVPPVPDISPTAFRAQRGAIAPHENITLPNARLSALPTVFWPTSSAQTSSPMRSDISQKSQPSEGNDVAMRDVSPLDARLTEVVVGEEALDRAYEDVEGAENMDADPMLEDEERTRFEDGLVTMSQDPATELMSSWIESGWQENATPMNDVGSHRRVSDSATSGVRLPNPDDDAFQSCESGESGMSASRRATKRRHFSLHRYPTRSSRAFSSEATSFDTAHSFCNDPDLAYEADSEK